MKLINKFIILAAVSAFGAASTASAVAKNSQYPKVTVKGDAESVLNLESMKGKVTIINFWATWCEACKVELVEMDHMFKELSKNPKIKFAFVSLDKSTSKAKEYITSKSLNGSVVANNLYYDSDFALAETLELGSFPTTLIVDGDGKVVFVQEGFKVDAGLTEKLVAEATRLAK